MSDHEHVAFLASSPNRVRVLRAIRGEPARQCALIDRLSLSRSTVQRCLGGFTERGWARRIDGRFHLTGGGAHVLARYEALIDTVGVVADHGDLLADLDDLARSLPPAAFADATAVTPSSDRPHAPETHLVDAFDTTDVDRFRGITPTVSEVFNDAAAPMMEAETDMELILDTHGFRVSREEFPDALNDAYTAEYLDLYVHPGEVGFGLAILDDRAVVTIYDDANRIRGCLDHTGGPFVEWAEEVYDDHRRAATRAAETPT